MKLTQVSKLATLAVALMLAVSAFAATDTHKASLQFLDSVQVNGKQVPAGDYQLKWEGNGPNVELNITQGRKVIATVPARVVELQQKSKNDAALIKNNGDGTRSLSEVRFGGKKFSLAVGDEAAQGQMKASDSSK
jgi:hypothetical protein